MGWVVKRQRHTGRPSSIMCKNQGSPRVAAASMADAEGDIPEPYGQLMKDIMLTSIPAALAFGLEFSPTIIALRIIGDLPGDHMAGVGLCLTWINVLCT